MLSITNLSVSIDDQAIIKKLNLQVAPGSVQVIMGPNGSGKSTLAYTLVGHPSYQVTGGAITYTPIGLKATPGYTTDITQLSPEKRAKLGIFLAFQHPYAIPGVAVAIFLREAYQAVTGTTVGVKEFYTMLEAKMALLGMDSSLAQRSLNDGFSGGEKKRLEMLQMLVLNPSLVILDEIDSGLDVDALKLVAAGITAARAINPSMAVLIITHYPRILQYIHPDAVHVMSAGRITKSGDAGLAHQIEYEGYDAFKNTSA